MPTIQLPDGEFEPGEFSDEELASALQSAITGIRDDRRWTLLMLSSETQKVLVKATEIERLLSRTKHAELHALAVTLREGAENLACEMEKVKNGT